jgi:genome maintenance exonuclease 1
VYNHIPSIIDYKTSKFFKKAEYIENYKLQTAAYTIAHDEMFGDLGIRQGVLLIGTRPNPEYNVPAKLQRVIIPEAEMQEYKLKWMDIVEEFHKEAA